MRTGDEEAFAELSRLFSKFEGHPPSNQREQWDEVDRYVSGLALSGWTREDIYHLVVRIDKNQSAEIFEECGDPTGGYITGLIGDVAVGHMVRLPGEPEDIEEHAAYVRGRKWMNRLGWGGRRVVVPCHLLRTWAPCQSGATHTHSKALRATWCTAGMHPARIMASSRDVSLEHPQRGLCKQRGGSLA